MRISLIESNRTPAVIGALCLAFATCLTGCASKNPLMEEPAAASTSTPATLPASSADRAATATPATSDVKAVSASRMQRVFGVLTPYRADIQQGNFVSREIMSQLKDAMNRKDGVSREQARFILGTPLLMDVFHADRWDYVFRLQKGNGDLITSHVTLFFKGNRLERFDGSELPTEKDYLALLVGAVPASKEPSALPESAPTPASQTK